MRTLSRFLVLLLLWIPAAVWAAGTCTEVKADRDFAVTVTIFPYDSSQTYDLFVEPRGNSGADIKVWSNKYDSKNPALINPNNSNLTFIDGDDYQIRFIYEAETRNSGTITYYINHNQSNIWTKGGDAELYIENNSTSDVTISGDALVGCTAQIPDTPIGPPQFEMCDYFPEPAQSWITQGTVNYSSYPQSLLVMSNGKQGQSITGWTTSYVQNNYKENGYRDDEYGTIDVLKVGFDSNTDTSNLHAPGTCEVAPCDTGGSDVNTRKVLAPPIIETTFPSDGSAIVNITPPYSAGQGYSMCDKSSLCSRVTDSTGTTVTIEQDLSKLYVASTQGERYTVIIDGNRIIKDLDVNSTNVEVILKANSSLTVNTASFSQSPKITAEDNIKIYVKNSWIFNNSVDFGYENGAKNSLIYAPEATVTISNPNADFYGYILAKNLKLENNITIYGAVTANNLSMATANTHIIASGSCFDPQPPTNTYTLDVTPDNQFALLCEAPEVTFTVYDQDGNVATDYDGTITATYPSGLTPENPTMGTKNSDYVYTPNNGVVVVPVDSNSLGEYTVQAELTGDSDANDQGKLLFGPYKFSATPDPVKAVAGHPTQFDVQVLACKDDAVTSVQGYSGDKDLKISDINLIKPTLADGASDGNLQVSNSESGSYSASDVTLNFSDDAKASAYLKYMQSGSLNFALTDPDFVCPEEYDGCEVNNSDGTSENIESLTGIINVDVRPWTFAICEPNSRDVSGDSNGGEGFVAAGEKFALRVAPIIWQSGGSLTEDVDVENFCNANVTTNFFLTNAQTATVLMGAKLATPTNGRLGSGIQSDDGLERAHNGVANSGDHYYSYTNLAWQEVGSLNINADTVAAYLGMDINLGYRGVGRFYPHHLVHVINDWDYAEGHSDFAYMNQPIGMGYTIEAQSEGNSATWNYGLFNPDLQNSIDLVAVEINSSGNEISDLTEHRLGYGENTDSGWSNYEVFGISTPSKRTAQYVVQYSDFMFLKDNTSDSTYTTTPDGPFNSTTAKFGAYVSDMKDNLDFDYTTGIEIGTDVGVTTKHGLAFILQPDFRYGRMALGNVSGPIGGPISVPLRTEYWNGKSFVTNTDDSGSEFKANVYYVMSNIEGSSAQLISNDPSSLQNVSNGKSSVLRAQQSNPQRETVRLFLRQGNQSDGYGNNAEPEADDELHATTKGWSIEEDIKQPWLQYNWRNKGDEDPSTVVTFGSYRGNDRIIYRGEPNMTAN